MLKMQQAEDQRKIMDTTIIESACKIYDINVWERIKSVLLKSKFKLSSHRFGKEINYIQISLFSEHVQTVVQMRNV